jgi:CelD/BcsL family acetyltransferase involved in cellulose biosynthesis
MNANYDVKICENLSYGGLKQEWKRLEEAAQPDFFLTWEWISTWIMCFEPNLKILTARYGGTIVAIGIFVKRTEKIHANIPIRRWRLHQTGKLSQDQVWIEYNKILCIPAHDPAASLACLRYIFDYTKQWDEIVLANVPTANANDIIRNFSTATVFSNTRCFSVDFEKLASRSFIDSLSRNSRYQIRRSIRRFETSLGPLTLQESSSLGTAIRWLHDAGRFHIQRWEDSGFKNKQFLNFHINLLKACHLNHSATVVRLKSGSTMLAIMYYFINRGIVYFYLQGVNRFKDPKLKPGLVAHYLAITHFQEKGYLAYDFMGGESQYKIQLCNKISSISTIIIPNKTIKMRIITLARKLKRHLIDQG